MAVTEQLELPTNETTLKANLTNYLEVIKKSENSKNTKVKKNLVRDLFVNPAEVDVEEDLISRHDEVPVVVR